jgi:hypothetical protein
MKNFHSFWLQKIKDKTKASFVGFETIGEELRIKIIKDGIPNYFILEGSFENVDVNTYDSLYNAIDDEQ